MLQIAISVAKLFVQLISWPTSKACDLGIAQPRKNWSIDDESQKVYTKRKNILRFEHPLDLKYGFGDDCRGNYPGINVLNPPFRV